MSQSPFLGVPLDERDSTEEASGEVESVADGSELVDSLGDGTGSVETPAVGAGVETAPEGTDAAESTADGSATEAAVDGQTTDVATLVAEHDVQAVLDAVDDADCRAILSETREEPLSASELSDRCDLPLSTTYRKVDKLTEAGLLADRTRIRDSGKHTSEFRPRIGDLTVSLGPEGEFSVRIARTDGEGE